ncbi:GNAT family N-acetyltransferase [Photobacterium sp. GB-50]|uniref:GNAT family N-acetyltransferase n=1 Tax=Photobacterium sp. GB-50 TaxID=2022107 RepID=UPI000D15A9F3|nr:N-acetyltransferase [Photobacterium sp. GB-50]PSW73219.1 GNAT family N-acetyltransferase [Photobacterium sp. GB-50]
MLYQIRQAEKSDLAAIYQLERELFGKHCYPDFLFRQAYDCWPSGLLVAVSECEHVVGYVLASPSFNRQTETQSDAWILGIAVANKVQGKGVGKALLNKALALLADYNRILLTVHPKNTAIKLYQRLGFVEIGQEDDYFGYGSPRIKMCLNRKE